MKLGHQVERAFLKYLQDNYPELKAVKSSEQDDLCHGTDIVINPPHWKNIRGVAIGVTTSPHRGKYFADAYKAKRKFDLFIEVVFDSFMIDFSSDEQLGQAFDNAACELLNDLPLIGSHVLYASHLDAFYHHI